DAAAITGTLKTAFDYFGARGRLKRWTLIRPKFTIGANITPGVALNVDFRDDAVATAAVASLSGLALWDSALWDVDQGAADLVFRNEWATVVGVGYCASLYLSASASGSGTTKPILRLNGVDYVWSQGGIV